MSKELKWALLICAVGLVVIFSGCVIHRKLDPGEVTGFWGLPLSP